MGPGALYQDMAEDVRVLTRGQGLGFKEKLHGQGL